MRQTSLLIGALLFLACFITKVHAQQPNEPAKVEVAVQFTSMIGPDIQPFFTPSRTKSESGIGARFTYNLTKNIALEAEGNLFNQPDFDDGFDSDNTIVQGQFGVKAGKRFEKFGVFAKARPGFISVGEILFATTTTININGQPTVVPTLDTRRQNFFTMDVGGVLEFYPSRRILVRFDAGDTMINTGDVRTIPLFLPPTTPPQQQITHNFQFSSGVAFRFMNPEPAQVSDASGSPSERKFEVGAQFSSLRLKFFSQFQSSTLGFEGVDIQSGFGGRLTYNFNSHIAAEVQSDFYPDELDNFANGRGGGYLWQVQAGPKIGKRFNSFGVFGKLRPGVVSFSKTTNFERINVAPGLRFKRRTYFSMDLGGVLEFYPSPRIVVRFDGGDTIIRYGDTDVPTFIMSMPVQHIPEEARHQFQFSAGVGFRF
ncbi:MAG TPA: hypothetical protein VJS17_08890 [Pyrinomonadaceae bacterium]|nr:hypothetical protein [Pyrinomonadaceae bacterium]